MKLFSRASQIRQTFKNVGRVREILRVLANHGFAEVVHRMKLTGLMPSSYTKDPLHANLPPQQRLRLAFEELGPTFVKLGQLLATRSDLLPEAFVDEFQKLQDRVKTLDPQQVKQVLEKEWRVPLEEKFEQFDETPMAAASMAQVHSAVLKDGTPVAIKIQRPGIRQVILNDISILRGLAVLLERYVPETRMINPTGIVDEFFRSIIFELDFLVEANNMRRIKENLKSLKSVAIPHVYRDLCTSRVLVLEKFEGTRLSDVESVLNLDIDPGKIIEAGCDAFFHMVLEDGIFHADPHAGNLFILKDGRLGFIDFGIVGRLSKRVKESMTTMFIAIMDEDYDSLTSEYLYLSRMMGECDVQRLQKDLMDLISPYIGMSLGEVNIGSVLLRSTTVAARHNLRVPRELMLLFKAIGIIESLGKQLDTNFDLLTVGNRLAKQSLARRYSKEQVLKDIAIVGRDLQYLLETAPRQFKRFLRTFSSNNFVIETKSKSIESLAASVQKFIYYFLFGAFTLSLNAIGITLLYMDIGPFLWGIPVLATTFLTAGLAGLAFGLWRMRGFAK